MSITTTATVPESQITYYERKFLARLLPNLIHAKWAQPTRIPRGNGKKVNMRRYLPLPRKTSPLLEGVTPAGDSLQAETIEVSVEQFGSHVMLSDVVQVTSVDPVITETSELQGEQAGGTLDELMRDVLNAGTTVRYAGGVAGRSFITTSHKFTPAEAKKAKRDLKRNKVMPFKGYYICIIHPDIEHDFTSDPKFVEAKQYARPEDLESGLIGRLDGVEYWVSPNAKVFEGQGSGGGDVYSSLMFGMNAYGAISYEADEAGGIDPQFGGEEQYQLPVKIIIKQLGSGGTEDPLDQRGSLGWKVAYAAKILQQLALVRIESGASE